MTGRPAAAVTLGFCNPYGAESGGPRRVLGGLYGPASAQTPGMHLPESVAQGEWICTNRAEVRCRMRCTCGHSGQVMELCSWHDEVTYHGEMVAGTIKQVKNTIRVRGHYEEIQRRQSSSCPRCLFPKTSDGTDYAVKQREWTAWTNELAMLNAAGKWYSKRADMVRSVISAIGDEFDIARKLGIIHNCPLTLTAVS